VGFSTAHQFLSLLGLARGGGSKNNLTKFNFLMASENDMDSDDELDNDDIRDAYSRSALSAVHSENTRAPSQAVVHSLHTTGIEIVRRDWLQLPEMYTKPLRMCAVNQFVHCEINLDERYLSTGAEYVLVGKGSSMPKHFHMFAYCMEQVSFRISRSRCDSMLTSVFSAQSEAVHQRLCSPCSRYYATRADREGFGQVEAI